MSTVVRLFTSTRVASLLGCLNCYKNTFILRFNDNALFLAQFNDIEISGRPSGETKIKYLDNTRLIKS